MSRIHTIVAPMSRDGRPVRLRLDLALVVAITDARDIDGSILLEAEALQWVIYQVTDEQLQELDAAWTEARP